MRKIKSAPANLCEMSHNKKIAEVSENNKIHAIINENNIESKHNKNFRINTLNKKRVSTIHTALITDTYFEISKKIPSLDNYYLNGMIDVINSFVSNKFNKQNLENLVISIIIRFVFSTICHEIIIKLNYIPYIDIPIK
tara:strand:- start:282 stop:698 length:417 start_codon:yes stop_codon:yes gene_type:complete